MIQEDPHFERHEGHVSCSHRSMAQFIRRKIGIGADSNAAGDEKVSMRSQGKNS